MYCIVDKANPLPTFKWQYQTSDCQDSDCSPDDSKWQSVPSWLLSTPSATPTNKSIVKIESDQADAFYRCQAFNSLGNDSQVIRFVRLGKNVLISLKMFQLERSGNDANLQRMSRKLWYCNLSKWLLLHIVQCFVRHTII